MKRFIYNNSLKSLIYIILLLGAVIILSTKGITNENNIAMNGDMARYLMNGVYLHDLLSELPVTNPFDHAILYFARYPALSLGHHPILLGIVEAPIYKIFGISVLSGKLTIVLFMLLAAFFWFSFIKETYDETIAILSSLLFVTAPIIVQYSRIVMSEIPTVSLIILTLYLLHKYCQSEKKIYAYSSAIIFVLSIYSKHNAVFMLPAYFMFFIFIKGLKGLVKSEVLVSLLIITILTIPLVAITLKFSQTNLVSVYAPISDKIDHISPSYLLTYHIRALWNHQLNGPVVILSLMSIFYALYKKDKRLLVFFIWIISCYLLNAYLVITRTRDSIYWVPAFCLFAAVSVNIIQHRRWKIFITVIIIATTGYQFIAGYKKTPSYAYGYEHAAKYIVENKKGESILYGAVEDTGYFIFFVRKHDKDRDLIILRSDKLFATSKMRRIVEDRITKKEEIYEALDNYGVGYVVIEDMAVKSPALELLRKEVKSSPNFILIKKISLQSDDFKINNVALSIYEYANYSYPKADKMLDMKIPLMGDSIRIPFKKLLKDSTRSKIMNK